MIYCCEHHDEALAHWRERDLRDIALAHVDFHDDLRGLLVDRCRQVAYPIGAFARERPPVDAGNFLAHALLEGRLRRVSWIHGAIGGRAWDTGIVRYESDLLSWHRRLLHRLGGGREVPLEFEERLLDRWEGPAPGDVLSVDWDCFASVLMDRDGIEARADALWDRLGPNRPPDSYLAYSPDYCHPTLDLFKRFVARLADRLAQPVEWLSPGLAAGRLAPSGVRVGLPRDPLMRFVLFLRRKGIY